ncbi:4-hydroxybutyrate CoA-transferase [Clostridia bacterium]|nr:4-hydroxybutyrate CoA-transferase [Clostridia bacterium]
MNESNLAEYKSKLRTPEQIIDMIEDGWYINAGQAAGGPVTLFDALGKNKAKDVTLQASLITGDFPFCHDDCGLWHEAWFFGPAERAWHKQHLSTFTPAHLSQCANRVLTRTKPSMFWGVSAPMDNHGNFNIAYGIAYEMDMLEEADIVVLEVNENAPHTIGENTVSIRDVDFFVESAHEPLTTNAVPTTELDDIIGRNVASLVEDRSVIQLGIGGIPNAVAEHFTDKKDLGVHTEMITDSMASLYEAGVITNRNKQIYRNVMVGTFVFGSKELYQFVDNNPTVQLIRGSRSNDPFVIAQNDNMVSINTCIQIDLSGQVCSEEIGTKQYSGTGGQFDTAYGAQRSRGGKSIIALHSTAKNDAISTIVPFHDRGAVVSLGRNDVDYVVTEYGVAQLRGRTVSQRVEALIAIAHPNFRDALSRQADEFEIW